MFGQSIILRSPIPTYQSIIPQLIDYTPAKLKLTKQPLMILLMVTSLKSRHTSVSGKMDGQDNRPRNKKARREALRWLTDFIFKESIRFKNMPNE